MDSPANPYQAPENEETPLFSAKLYVTGKNCKPGLIATRRHVILTKRFLHVGERTVPLEEIQEIGIIQPGRIRRYFQGLKILLRPTSNQEENAIFLADKTALGAVRLKKLEKLKALIIAEQGFHEPIPEKVSWLNLPTLIWQQHLKPAFNQEWPIPFRILSFVFFVIEMILPVWLVVAGFRFSWLAGVIAISVGYMLILPWTFLLVSFMAMPAYVLVAKIFKLPIQIQEPASQ